MPYDDDNFPKDDAEPEPEQSGESRDLVPGGSRALVPQPHGGALRPWTPGNGPGSGGAARRSSIRAIRKETLEILTEGTPEAGRRLLGLMRSRDERVAAIACSQIMDRVLGKATDLSQHSGEDSTALDLSSMSHEQQDELMAAIATIARLTGNPALAGITE